MLAYVLALAVGLGSLAIYMAAFFFPEVHRKNDFIWSGLGLFYALVLWVCAGRITGGVLLGQVASVTLLGWSVTQTLQLRRQLTPLPQQTELPSAKEVKHTVEDKLSSLSSPQRLSQLGGTITGVKNQIQQRLSAFTRRQSQSNSAPASRQDANNQIVQVIDHRTPIPQQPVDTAATEQLMTETESATMSVPEPDELIQAAKVEEELFPEVDAEMESGLTEEEAIALAVENTLASDATLVSDPIRPHPPDPKLVEAALRDAEEKHEQASPPNVEEGRS